MTKKAKELLDKKRNHLDNMDYPIKRHHRIIDNLSVFVTDEDEAFIVVSDCSQRNDNVVVDNSWEEAIPIPARRTLQMMNDAADKAVRLINNNKEGKE